MCAPSEVPLTRWQRLLVVALLGLLFAQAVMALPRLSLTADEPVYIGAGYAFLRSGDLRMATAVQHPPLMQVLAAMPLLMAPGPELSALEGWDTAEMARFAPAFVSWYGDGLDAATFAARLPIVGLTLLWAAFLFRWAADWFGPWGGITALTLFTFDPNILAHATLATNDVGFAAFSLIALFAATRLLRHSPFDRLRMTSPDRPFGKLRGDLRGGRYVILAGLALGGSLSSKSSGFFTALALATSLPLAALASQKKVRQVLRALLQLALIIGLGILVLWAVYGFECGPPPRGALSEGGPSVPLATQWQVWREMRQHLAQGHTGYLMGEIRDTGWLGYYPLALAIKTPPLTLMLLVLSVVGALAAGPRRWWAMLPLWMYAGGYTAATLLSSVSIGYRFLLPLLPLGFILIAGLSRAVMARLPSARWRWGSWAVLALLSASVALRFQPHYLTYFNAFIGGPAQGQYYLVDSNLDWGQSFKALQTTLDERGIERVRLSYYTYTDPALYGVRYEPIAPAPDALPVLPARFNPAPGMYAISATTLQGVMVTDPDTYSWFRQRQPIARPGRAILVYEVPVPPVPPSWLAQCTQPAPPLTPQAVVAGFGRDDLRLTYFDCTQSWLYPQAEAAPGWYALHRDAPSIADPFIARHLQGTQPGYEQRTDRALSAFTLYEQPLEISWPEFETAAAAALAGPLRFLGYSAPSQPLRPGESINVETWWQVQEATQRPLSLMLHLIGPDNTVLVGDGLGVPVEQWQHGDVLVQRHHLELPSQAPAGNYTLYTGAYWLDTLERLAVTEGEKTTGDQITLSRILMVASK